MEKVELTKQNQEEKEKEKKRSHNTITQDSSDYILAYILPILFPWQ